MLIALLVAVVVAIVVKLVLGLFSTTAPYADVIAVVVGILVFLSRLGIGL
jgi:hypothetical protein